MSIDANDTPIKIVDKDGERTMPEITIEEPIPDELCKHVELGAEMTGGWYFVAHEPPIAVGMCHECIVWCREHFDPDGQMPWSEYSEQMRPTPCESAGS